MLERLDELTVKYDIRYLILFMGILYVFIVSFFAFRAHSTFYTNCWDLGIYSQSLYSTLKHGKMLYYTAELPGNPSGSLFGIHFTPFLFLLVPIYAIFPNPLTLLVLRPIIIAFGLLPVYLIAKEKGLDEKSVLFLSFLYLIYLPVMFPFYNFDVEVFLVPIFLFLLYFMGKEDFLKSYAMVILSLMVNEFAPFIALTISVYLILSNRRRIINRLKEKRLEKHLAFSMLILITAVVWYVGAAEVITFYNPTALKTKWEWGELGSGPLKILTTFILTPSKGFGIIGTDLGLKLFYMVAVFAPLAFLPFLEPLPLLMAAPWFAASMISINPQYYSVEAQYPSFFYAFIFYSTVIAWKKITESKHIRSHSNPERKLAFIIVIINIITVISLIPVFSPKAELLEMSSSDKVIHEALKVIPRDASVSVMPEIFPHLCNRLEVYPYYMEGTDYILIDRESWWYTVILPRPAHLAGTWEDADISQDYEIVLKKLGICLMKYKK